MKLLTVIGARPQIIKASAISRAVHELRDSVQEVILHTGQHYDDRMSKVFFEELEIPAPSYNLGVGSGPHGTQTAKMILGLEEVLLKEKADFLIVYGDTNSTLAAAIAASKEHIPVVHIEAGLRSFNKTMPEEINRILCDHVSTFLFPPTETGMQNLEHEGFKLNAPGPYSKDNPGVFNFGDVMYDNSLFFSQKSDQSDIISQLEIEPGEYLLCTVHRDNNVRESSRLKSIIQSLLTIADSVQRIVFPIHPNTRKQLGQLIEPALHEQIEKSQNLQLIPPCSFLEMIQLQKSAKMIITDSGGIQKEAFFFAKPCIVLRPETEWVELVNRNAAVLCDADTDRILGAYQQFESNPQIEPSEIFGDGQAAKKILQKLLAS